MTVHLHLCALISQFELFSSLLTHQWHASDYSSGGTVYFHVERSFVFNKCRCEYTLCFRKQMRKAIISMYLVSYTTKQNKVHHNEIWKTTAEDILKHVLFYFTKEWKNNKKKTPTNLSFIVVPYKTCIIFLLNIKLFWFVWWVLVNLSWSAKVHVCVNNNISVWVKCRWNKKLVNSRGWVHPCSWIFLYGYTANALLCISDEQSMYNKYSVLSACLGL